MALEVKVQATDKESGRQYEWTGSVGSSLVLHIALARAAEHLQEEIASSIRCTCGGLGYGQHHTSCPLVEVQA